MSREGVAVERPTEVFHSIIDARLHGALRRALEQAGHRSFPVPGGHTGWNVIKELHPPLLIIEVPEGNLGQISLLERMERDRKTRSIPIIVFTKDLRLEFRLRGVYEFLHDYEAVPRCLNTVAEIFERIRGRGDGSGSRDLLLTLDDSRALEDVIHLKTGIVLKRERMKRVEDAIRSRMTALRLESFQEYLHLLRIGEVDESEWKLLVPALTIDETSFFRTSDQFRALEEVAIPSILDRKGPNEPIRIWVAGCSSGEEAYSVAISLRERIPDPASHPFVVIATDINEEVLEEAKEGAYSERAARKMPENLLKKYFVRLGDTYHPEQSLRRSITFKHFNLQSPASAFRELCPYPVDVIFCRNVVIYFRKVTIQRLVERFYSILADPGYLFLGYSETLYKFRHRFQTLFWRGTFFYQKRPPLEVSAPPPARELGDPEDLEPPVESLEELPAILERPPEAAASRSRVVTETHPDPYALMAAGDIPSAEAAFSEGSGDGWEALVGKAYACIRDRRTGEAEGLLRQVREEDDVRAEGYYISGLIQQSRGNLDLARTEYERAIFLDEHFYPAHIQLAELQAAERKHNEAIRSFRNAIRSLPASSLPYLVTLEGVFPRDRVQEILEDAILEMEEART